MARLIRGALVAFLAVFVGLAGALPSHAVVAPSPSPSTGAPVYGCLDPVDEYGVPRQCQLTVQILSPVCDDDVAKLRYKVVAVGTPETTVTLTWINPNGDDVVYADLPLEGTVNWPGSAQGPDGQGIDWPGWRQLADKSWVKGDQYDWTLPTVNVLFQAGAEATMTVAYPPSTAACLTEPPGDDEVLAASDPKAVVLSATGSDSGPLLAAAAGLVVVGALALTTVAIARRRRAML